MMQKSETASAMYNPIIQLLPVQTTELSDKAKLLKNTLATLAICCDEINTVSRTNKTSNRFLPGTLALTVQGLFLLSSSEVYRELFGEYPTRTQ